MGIDDDIDILVIDDEKDIRDGCERILQRMGCKVLTAASGKEGLEILEKSKICIVLCDIKMPGMDGLEVLTQIRKTHESILVIMITGFSTVETAIEAMKKGAYDFLSKPFTPDQLRINITRAIEKIRLTRQAECLKLERQRNLADLETEQSRIRTIIENLPNGLLVTNLSGQVVLINPLSKTYLGLSQNMCVGEKIEHYIADKGLCDYIMGVSKCSLTDTKPPENYEFSLSEERYVLAQARPIEGEDGECMGAVVILSDISAIKVFDRLKTEFVAKVSHELRSPLSVIHEQLAMVLKANAPDSSDDNQYILGRAKEKTKSLITMIADLLDISKIETGNKGQMLVKVHLDDMIGKIVEFLTAAAQKKQQSIKFNIAAKNIPPVVADPIALESVFGNLIENAIKYTREQGSILISIDTKDNYVRVIVKDNGFGMEQRHISRIFEKFYRIKDDNTRFINGTGLGLPIAKAIVDALNGQILVKSQVGKGSEFTVLLPADKN
ncbi:hybrid sensor histidine kinase/response regulator [Desulfobacula phenolica]|uniref:histidine kinase n=1 Tax=Desulfobacula phenolica TaxID=90732 RepID=A0A1H2J3B5_9BACT|nr:response regulator [Desulfobacula phenolica]SDU50645.1 PAS/PAC sensor hybrid histidine kinase [Desulfobacula phenolica]